MNVKEADALDAERRARQADSGAPRKRYPWFGIKINESATIRFLSEYDGPAGGVGLWRHSQAEKPKNVSCFTNEEYGHRDCPFCAKEANKKGTAPRKLERFWWVYNYATKQVEILAFKDTSFTPVTTLKVMFDNSGTIKDRDFIILRQPAASPRGDGRQASVYVAIGQAPTGFAVPLPDQPPTRDDLIEYLRPWEVKE